MGKFISLFILLASILQGGIGEDRVSLIVEGRGGLFRPAPKNFTKIYGDNNMISGATLGIGYRSTYLVARYRLFEAEGKSIVTGIDLEGSATWREEFISLGLRSYAQKLFYAELAYVMGSVKESISTNEPDFKALNSTFSTSNNQGAAVALGINIPIVLGFNLSGEVEYLFVQTKTPNGAKNDKIDIGGPIFSLGLSLVF